MATVRKRKWTHNGKPAEAWVVNYTDQAGKRRQKTFDKKKDADAFRVHTEGEIQQGVHVAETASVTVNEAERDYLIETERRWNRGDITGQTWQTKRARSAHLVDRLGHRVVSGLTSKDFQDMLNSLRDERGFKANTKRWSCFFDQFAALLRWIMVSFQAAHLIGSVLLS